MSCGSSPYNFATALPGHSFGKDDFLECAENTPPQCNLFVGVPQHPRQDNENIFCYYIRLFEIVFGEVTAQVVVSPTAPQNPEEGWLWFDTVARQLMIYNELGVWETALVGGISSVTASAPLASSGGANPNISIASAIPLSLGGTGATDAAAARANLSVSATGTDTTYAFRANNLSDLASASSARTNLGLGTISTQNSNSVSITGGSITGITDLAVADGGTGVSTIPSNGQLLIGNGSGYTVANLTAGTGITINNGAGSISISATESQTATTLIATVTNAESFDITKGQVVYAFAATGNRMSVKLAANTSDATSAKTVGVVSSDSISANGVGTITMVGVLDGLNLGTYNEGDTVYLGATPGTFTNVKPYAPNHLVYVGIIERANAGNGELYVRVQNGYEVDEIHDIQINAPRQSGQTLIYDATTSLWKNARLTAGAGVSIVNGPSSITISADGGVNYQGTWNANTNSPALTSSVGTKGFYYVVSVAGTTNLDGITDWQIGDWAVFNGTVWEKVDTTDAVQSVFGRTGAVAAVSTDYSSVGITNTAIGATNPSTGSFTSLSASDRFMSTDTWNASDGNGQIFLNGTIGNRIDFSTAGVAAPAFGTRSLGTKIVINPQLTAGTADFAIGFAPSSFWFSVPTNSSLFRWEWYGGTTSVASLFGNGALSISGGFTTSSGSITGGASGLTLNSGGTNQNITLTPSGTGVISTIARITSSNSTASTSTTSGSATFAGGIGVVGDIYAGSIQGTPIGSSTASTGAFTNLSASGTFSLTGDTVQISEGGTGASDAPTARTNLGLGTVATKAAPSGTSAQLLANDGSGGFSNVTVGSGLSYAGGTLSASGGGTVTSVSVVSANGLAGTVANASTTPAITLSTTVTGLLKGDGTAISAATAGTDYAAATTGSNLLAGNGAGGFTNVSTLTGLTYSAGTLAVDWASPGTIGSTTPNTGAFTTLTVGTSISGTTTGLTLNASGTNQPVTITPSGNGFATVTNGRLRVQTTSGGANIFVGGTDGNGMVTAGSALNGLNGPIGFGNSKGFYSRRGVVTQNRGPTWGSGWLDGGTTPDTGIGSSAAGAVEINDGTIGNYRDLTLRDITSTGTTASTSTTTGSAKFAGGVGVAGAIYAGSIQNTPIGSTTASTGAFTNLSASGTFALTGDTVQISEGGTGASDAPTARTNLGLGTVATKAAPSGTSAQLLANDGSGGFSNVTVGSGLSYTGGTLSATAGGTGTVTDVSVVSANGFAGSVATSTTTPAITLSTTITGLLKGNGTAISAASAGTDYAAATTGSNLLAGNGAGGFTNVSTLTGLTYSAGTLAVNWASPGAIGSTTANSGAFTTITSSSTAASTSTTTGGATFAGGVGIAGNLSVPTINSQGGGIVINGSTTDGTRNVITGNTRVTGILYIGAIGTGAVMEFISGGLTIYGTRFGAGNFDVGSAGDTIISRASAGVAQINNGTAGQFRDLQVRDINVGPASNTVVTSSANTTTTSTAQATIASVAGATYRSAKFIVQAVDATGAKFQTLEILAVHNGTTATSTEYASINSGGSCATYTVDYNAGSLRLLATPTSANSTVFKVTQILTKV